MRMCCDSWVAAIQLQRIFKYRTDFHLVFLPALVAAQNSTITAAATFYFEETETQFSVNVANDSSDVFIYLTSPAYSWVGFGFGAKMENSLMFVAYPNAKGDSMFPLHHQILISK